MACEMPCGYKSKVYLQILYEWFVPAEICSEFGPKFCDYEFIVLASPTIKEFEEK